MNRTPAAFIALLITMLAGALGAQDDDGLTWLDDYAKAMRIAKQTHKPLFIEYRCEP